MRKFYFILLFAAVALMPFMSACSSSDDDSDGEGTDYLDYPYSSLNVSQQKEKLSQDARVLINKMNGLQDSKALALLVQLSSMSTFFESDVDEPVTPFVKTITEINEFYGKYTWDFDKEDWVKSESTDKLVLIFPASSASDSSRKNDGKVEVTGVASSATTDDGYRLPKELNAQLYVDDKKVGSVSVNAVDISDSVLPKAAKIVIALENYTLSMEATKGSVNTASFAFTRANDILLEGAANLQADLDDIVVEDGDGSIGESVVEVRILDNLLIAHKGNVGELLKGYDRIEKEFENSNWTEAVDKSYCEKRIAVWNTQMKSALVARADEAKIADVISVLYVDEYSGRKDYSDDMGFKFNDSTIVNADVFFGEGFSAVVSAWEDFIEDFYK